MSKVGVVIVNYACHELTCRCIASLKEYITCAELCFIVVDNSGVNEKEYIVCNHPDVVFLRSGENSGFAAGCNAGIRYSLEHNYNFIQLINPDTRAEHDFLAPLLKVMTDPRIALAGPKILYDNKNREVWYGGAKMNWWLGGPVQIFDGRNDGRGRVQKMPCLSGCAILLRAEAVREVGMMDEGYFLYYEDIDYCQRFLGAGMSVVYVPESQVLHAVSSSVGFQTASYVYFFSRNRIRFMGRWATWYHYFVYMLFNLCVKVPGAIVVFGIMRKKPALSLAYLRGLWHGLTGKIFLSGD